MADPRPSIPDPDWQRRREELTEQLAAVLERVKPDPLMGLSALASVMGGAIGTRIKPEAREEIVQRLVLQLRTEMELAAPTRAIALMLAPSALEARRQADAAVGDGE